jgi:hypothetical protein
LDVLKQVGLPNTDACCAYTNTDASYQKRVRLACCPSLQKEYYKDTSLFNQNNLAFFSSRGMTEDKRFKPDLVAPGYQVQSMHSDGKIDSFQCGTSKPAHDNDASVLTMKGTSMATPVVAGSLALIREYLRLGYYPTGSRNETNSMPNPSSALIRALAIHSAVPLKGTLDHDYRGTLTQLSMESSPNPYTGFGQLSLNTILKFNDSNFDISIQDRVSILNGYQQKYCIRATEKGSIRITVVWTDYPSVLGSAKTLVNDVNVAAWSGLQKYFGNGQLDDVNTVEQITIDNVDAGKEIPILVSAKVIKEIVNYAIVITGRFEIIPTCEIPSLNVKFWGIFLSSFGILAMVVVLTGGIMGCVIFGFGSQLLNLRSILSKITLKRSQGESEHGDEIQDEEVSYYEK